MTNDDFEWKASWRIGQKSATYPVEHFRLKFGESIWDVIDLGAVYGSPSESKTFVLDFRAHDFMDEREYFSSLPEAKKWVEDRATRYAEAILKHTKR